MRHEFHKARGVWGAGWQPPEVWAVPLPRVDDREAQTAEGIQNAPAEQEGGRAQTGVSQGTMSLCSAVRLFLGQLMGPRMPRVQPGVECPDRAGVWWPRGGRT